MELKEPDQAVKQQLFKSKYNLLPFSSLNQKHLSNYPLVFKHP
jgi:hypothetical protein